MLELFLSIYVIGMLRVLYGFGAVVEFLTKPESRTTEVPQGEGRGGCLPAQEYHFVVKDSFDYEGDHAA